MLEYKSQIEALIFASETGVTLEEVREVLLSIQAEAAQDTAAPERGSPAQAFEDESLLAVIDQIRTKYGGAESILELKKINKAYVFLTKAEYHPTINLLQSHRSRKKLSQAALETLAIVAYRQPITKLEIEHIRGVNCDYTIQRLLERDLITIVGKSDSVGRPLLYGTSALLMDYFGLNDLSELPRMKEIMTDDNRIGDPQD